MEKNGDERENWRKEGRGKGGKGAVPRPPFPAPPAPSAQRLSVHLRGDGEGQGKLRNVLKAKTSQNWKKRGGKSVQPFPHSHPLSPSSPPF